MSNSKAQAKYHVRRKEIETKLQNIRHMVAAHRLNAGDELNWGHVGDLALVSEQLNEVASFLEKEEMMSEEKMKVEVQYSTDGLFGATDPDDYDEKESIRQFGSSLENYLAEAYPTATIMISYGIGDYVKVDGMEDHEETPWIEQIVEKCWNGDDWLVGK